MNAANATTINPIVRGDQNPPPETVWLLVGLFEGKFHWISVGEGVTLGVGLGVTVGIGVGVDGGKVGTLGYPCAFTTGAIATIEVNILKTNNARVTIAKFFFKPTRDFSNIDLSSIPMVPLQI